MRYHILASDYDGTLAHHGRVDKPTLAALERLLATGRQLILVTGRELEELLGIFPEIHLFTRVVAENGALLYYPATKKEKILAKAPPPEFVATLRQRGVAPMSVGRTIVATWRPHENTVLQTIVDLGLELQVIFNKDAVMVLPSGVNKATGLIAALKELGYSPHEAVGVGDAENDHAFLNLCECSVAVDNALASLKKTVDLVARGDHGRGVIELIDYMVGNDLSFLNDELRRHRLLVGHGDDRQEIWLAPYGYNVLIAGPSGSGKSTAATSFLERLRERRYQFCIIDPEGDYDHLEGAVTLGNPGRGPTPDEVLQMLADAGKNSVVNLVGMPLGDRPQFFLSLLPRLQELRNRTGRPHWLVVDEAHHLLPASWSPGPHALPAEMKRTVFITVHPEQVAGPVLAGIDKIMAVGPAPEETINRFHEALAEPLPTLGPIDHKPGDVFLWSRKERAGKRVHLIPTQAEHHRHVRKYAEGELPPERSFFFRGPAGKLKLRAQNLMLFMQIGDGVDDETWMHHLRAGDYSHWFRVCIKDEALADKTAVLEQQVGLSADEGRARIRALIEKGYTLASR